MDAPMPASAWELVALWCDVWDAPRFRDGRQLSREASLPLLKLAASCVAQLGGRQEGASRDYLVAVLEGRHVNPLRRPADFVRDLVKATFMTGDGEPVDSSIDLDELINTRCAKQLELSTSLVKDPAASLKVAMEKLTDVVEKVAALPFEEGDSTAVASRLLLIQRLERAVEDGHALLRKDVESSLDEEETESTMEPEEAQSSEADVEEKDNPLKRTKSQVAAKLKVQKVKEHQQDMSKEVYDLGRTTSALAKHEESNESEKLETELVAVEEARKKARNFGEDLLEDMLALDNLSGLSDEDRSTRKATLANLEGLLQDVDTAKSRLAMLHRQLEGKLSKAQKAEAAKVTEATVPPREERSESQPAQLALPTPQKGTWEKVRLPLRFNSREGPSRYVISATVPGLDLDDLKLELGETSLVVQGLRVPSTAEATAMRKRIAQKIRQVAQSSPEQFEKLVKALPEVAADAYIELGQGDFGRFQETFRLPKDVDREGVEASYTDGQLRVVLPRLRQRPEVVRSTARGPGLGRGAAGPWGGKLFGGHDDFFRW